MNEISNNFTPRAQQVIALSRKEADRLNHNFIGTEHLLIGLVRLGQGTAVNVLRRMGIDLETVRNEVEQRVEKGPDPGPVQGSLPYTPRVKKALALAAKEAENLHHTYVGTEHLLLGLLREDEGLACQVLRGLNVDIERTRLEVLKELGPNLESEESRGAGREAASPASRVRVELSSGSAVNTNQYYDVYCVEGNQRMVVYRNARLKGTKHLFPNNSDDSLCVFVELQDRNQQSVLVARSSIIRFCEPGVVPAAEAVHQPSF